MPFVSVIPTNVKYRKKFARNFFFNKIMYLQPTGVIYNGHVNKQIRASKYIRTLNTRTWIRKKTMYKDKCFTVYASKLHTNTRVILLRT